jgi:glyoxylase-like metal-dependent hydrolase (beta-lactamase superfamily II)
MLSGRFLTLVARLHLATCASVLAAAYGFGTAASATELRVEVYKGEFASVNSFIFSNGKSLVVMDVQRNSSQAKKLVDLVKSKNLPLTHIIISHGHTDHFTGMALFHEEFPQAKIVVAREDIRRDIKEYAIYMDRGGATGAEPALDPTLRPRSPENPTGFDYEHTIQVLPEGRLTLDGGGTLELTSNYPPTEAKHMTTVYSKELNALFVSDLGYNHVHAWMGDDISRQRIATWRAQLVKLRTSYLPLNPKVYPGHGDPTDMSLFDRMIHYIDDFLHVTSRARSREEAMHEMESLYPDYSEADFFLKYSIENHVR